MTLNESRPSDYSPVLSPLVTAQPSRAKRKKGRWVVGGLAIAGVSLLAGGFTGYAVGYESARIDIAESLSEAFSEPLIDSNSSNDSPYSSYESTQSESIYPVTLSVGESVDVPCSMYLEAEGDCMSLTLTDIVPHAACPESYGHSGRFISLSFEATMPDSADPEFSSPFRSFPWSVVTSSNQKSSVMDESMCNGDSSQLDLMQEFPGYSALGTAYLPVPEDASEVHFESDNEPLFVVNVD